MENNQGLYKVLYFPFGKLFKRGSKKGRKEGKGKKKREKGRKEGKGKKKREKVRKRGKREEKEKGEEIVNS